ncbi:ATP-binding protein, partial [Zoogloea sp.]|uniref:ATP-binding protein n=1 Tax=Zoogloea sp. TaxID=49181 RepID=UPI0035AEBA87
LALAAGRLLLRRPGDPGLTRLAAAHLATDTPQQLATGIASGAELLFATLDAAPHANPLARIASGCQLSGFDLDLLAFAVLPCFDEDAAATIASLTGGPRRLSVGLALKLLFGDHPEPAPVRHALRVSPLWQAGLIRPDETPRPLLERRLDPTETLLAGLDGLPPAEAGPGWQVRRIVAPAQPAASIERAARQIADTPGVCLHLSGQAERAEEVLAVAAAPLPALVLDAPDDSAPPPWAEAHLLRLATGARVALRTDAGQLTAPVGVPPVPAIAPPGFSLRGPGAHLRRLEVGGSDPLELADAWQRALGCTQADADELAGRNWIDDEAPARVAAALPPGASVPDALAELARMTPPRALRLATRTTPDVPWQRVVLPPQTRDRLEDLIRRVRRRVGVQLRWQMARGARGRSVIGLLYGESGTGKTLAAEAIATRLHLPMLSVDLSLVVSKYIGETEKNLSELFAAAEGYAALLFFDEADALFGRRTNVQDAHDRYANIEVNYLLQRLESFEGCALLATNLMQGVDDAFLRRFDQVVHFPRPGVAERMAIWRGQLPTAHLAPEISIEQLAERFELTGGEIRNAALSAAFMAADGGTVVTDGMIDAAVAEEFSKLGRPFPRRQGAFP